MKARFSLKIEGLRPKYVNNGYMYEFLVTQMLHIHVLRSLF